MSNLGFPRTQRTRESEKEKIKICGLGYTGENLEKSKDSESQRFLICLSLTEDVDKQCQQMCVVICPVSE